MISDSNEEWGPTIGYRIIPAYNPLKFEAKVKELMDRGKTKEEAVAKLTQTCILNFTFYNHVSNYKAIKAYDGVKYMGYHVQLLVAGLSTNQYANQKIFFV